MNNTPFENVDLTDKERIDLLRSVLDSSLDAVISIDINGKVLEWSISAENLFLFSKEEAIGKNLDTLIIPEDLINSHKEGMNRYKNTGHHNVLNKRIEIEAINKNKQRFPVELAISPIEFRGEMFFTARLREITERKKYELQLLLTSKELAHREKNSLAIISAVFRQISKYAKDIEEFKRSFDSWLTSYKNTHELLSENQSMSLLERAKIEFEPYNNDKNIFISGPDVILNRHASLNFGLCLHEMVTNSVKHGSLSVDTGTIHFNTSITDTNVIIHWREFGGPPPKNYRPKGFGTQLLKTALIQGLKGNFKFDFLNTGLKACVEIPLISIKS